MTLLILASKTSSACRARRFLAWLAAAALVLMTGAPALAQDAGQDQARTRFLLNFLRFTEWPEKTFASESAPLQVCVLGVGDDAIGGALAGLRGTVAAGRKVHVHAGVAAEGAADCHLLYVPDNELHRMPGARESIGRRPVLIVGESEAILERGGIVALRSIDRHLAFVVNLGAARRVNLKFSPQMLNAAAEILP